MFNKLLQELTTIILLAFTFTIIVIVAQILFTM